MLVFEFLWSALALSPAPDTNSAPINLSGGWWCGMLRHVLYSNNIISFALMSTELVRHEWVVWCESWTASVKYGVGFVSSGGLSVYRSVFSIGVAVIGDIPTPLHLSGNHFNFLF